MEQVRGMRMRRALRPLRLAVRRAQHEWQVRSSPIDHIDVRGGPVNYIDLLGGIHALLRPRTYIEIGVAKGKSFARARPTTLALGIDPAADVAVPIGGKTKFYRVSSDEFFRDRDVRAELEGRRVDLAFIDGLHIFEQALRDFINLERFCSPRSVILMHDCLPRDRETSSREEQQSGFWTGDVWKVVPCLTRVRPDLFIRTLDVPPAGLAVVRNLDPSSTVLRNIYDELCEEWAPLDYEDLLAAGKSESLNLVGHDWKTVRAALGATGIRSRLRWWLLARRAEGATAH